MKLRFALFLTLVAMLVIVGTVLADPFTPVNYTDTQSEFDSPETGAEEALGSFILNGAFDDWTGGEPDHWTIWEQSKAGWEAVHMGPADLAQSAAGMNDALGMFIRHTGGDGGFYSGVYQPLSLITTGGYYFVNISEAIWYNDDRETAAFNSVAWYAITDSTNPFDDVDAWRELDPYEIQCANSFEVCNYAGRDETVWIDPGSYFHLIVAQKFPVFNASTVFVIDDVSITGTDGNLDYTNGFYDWINESPEDVKFHWMDDDCFLDDCSDFVEVNWDKEAPR
jgi:hypothetical protein